MALPAVSELPRDLPNGTLRNRVGRLAWGFVASIALTVMLSSEPHQLVIRSVIIGIFMVFVCAILPVPIKLAVLLAIGWVIEAPYMLERTRSEVAGPIFFGTDIYDRRGFWGGRYDKLRALLGAHRHELTALSKACDCPWICTHRHRLDPTTRHFFEQELRLSIRRAVHELQVQLGLNASERQRV